MNLREFVVWIYIGALSLSICGILAIPWQTWSYIGTWQILLFVFYILVGFCGILIAYWVSVDYERIIELEIAHDKRLEKLREEIKKLKKTI